MYASIYSLKGTTGHNLTRYKEVLQDNIIQCEFLIAYIQFAA